MRALNGLVLDGNGAGTIVVPLLVLVAFAVLCAAVAVRRLRVDDDKVGWT